MRAIVSALVITTLIACGDAKKPSAAAQSAEAPEDWSGIQFLFGDDRPVPEEFKPAFRAAFNGLPAGEKPTGYLGYLGSRKDTNRFVLVAMNAPQGDARTVRFFYLTRGGDNSAPPAYETGIPYEEGNVTFKVNTIGNRDRDSLPDLEYCRFSGVPPQGSAFVAGFRYDAWYRIDENSGRPCTTEEP